MIYLTTEEKIILLLSRLHPPAEVIENVKDLIEDKGRSLDYSILTKLASGNQVGPLLYSNLKELNLIPDDVMNRLKNSYLHTIKNNMQNAHEMMRILTLFKQRDVEVMPLKGALASEMIFGNPGLYPSLDIDILVKPSNLSKADNIVTEAGYSKSAGMKEEDLLSSHYHFLYSKGRHHLELHWNLVKRYFTIPPDFWWEDVRKIEYEGMEITTLSIERYIMYTIFRLFDHGFRPLKFFVLISEMINKYREEIDWDRLFSFSEKYKIHRVILFTLKLLNELLGAKIPEGVKKEKMYGYDRLKKIAVSGIFHEVTRQHLRMFIYTFLLDTPHDFARILIRRFFPGKGEIRLRYGLPANSKKVYAYYVLNPLLVLLKKRSL